MKFLIPEQYQPKCSELFDRIKFKIKNRLPHARVEHIGASSIPNAISKGDLDVFVGVRPTELEASVEILKQIGFREKLDTLRTAELCMLEERSGEDVALQVVANGSEFEFFITFRDKLRQNPDLIGRYNELKKHCEGFDQDAYRRMKSEFIVQVLALV